MSGNHMADTSLAAHAGIQPEALAIKERIRDYIKDRGYLGATIDECSTVLGIRESTACGRFGELKDEIPPAIVCLGERRKTTSGYNAHVYVSADLKPLPPTTTEPAP